MFLAERSLQIATRQVDLRGGEQFTPDFLAINPDATVPVLKLEDGTILTDIVGICKYLDEITDGPSLFGNSPVERARVDGMQRWLDREAFYVVADAFRNSTPGFRGRALTGPIDYEQLPGLALRSVRRVSSFFERFDRILGAGRFAAGDKFTIADITAFVSIEFAGWVKARPDARQVHLHRWLDEMRSRPSAEA